MVNKFWKKNLFVLTEFTNVTDTQAPHHSIGSPLHSIVRQAWKIGRLKWLTLTLIGLQNPVGYPPGSITRELKALESPSIIYVTFVYCVESRNG